MYWGISWSKQFLWGGQVLKILFVGQKCRLTWDHEACTEILTGDVQKKTDWLILVRDGKTYKHLTALKHQYQSAQCSYYRIAGNFRWCKFSRKSVLTLQKKFSRFIFSRNAGRSDHTPTGWCDIFRTSLTVSLVFCTVGGWFFFTATI